MRSKVLSLSLYPITIGLLAYQKRKMLLLKRTSFYFIFGFVCALKYFIETCQIRGNSSFKNIIKNLFIGNILGIKQKYVGIIIG